MHKTMKMVAVALLAAICLSAQITPTPVPVAAPPPPPLYSYFAETGITYDYFAHTPASTTGFGVRIGSSNVFSVTDVDTTVAVTGGLPAQQYATLRTGLEYHVATSGGWEMIGFSAIGATNTSSGTQASFAGGVGLSYDIGGLLSRGKFKLPIAFEYRLNAITATEVTTNYTIVFRKTF